jgi:hypothetical protein
LVQKDNLSNLWNSAAFVWLLFAVLAGAIFGGAGGWSRDRNRRLRVDARALDGKPGRCVHKGHGDRTVAFAAICGRYSCASRRSTSVRLGRRRSMS